MSGFCCSIGMLRGPGSVPPRPGRIGCGGLPCPVVCALAEAAAATRPAAPVVRTVRRDGAMSSLLLVGVKERYDGARAAAMGVRARAYGRERSQLRVTTVGVALSLLR